MYVHIFLTSELQRDETSLFFPGYFITVNRAPVPIGQETDWPQG